MSQEAIAFNDSLTDDAGRSYQGPVKVSTAKPLPTTPYAAALTIKGYQQITSLAAATGLTVPSGATIAIIRPETQAVRWRDDGTSPTATVGQPLGTSDELYYDVNLAAIEFIEQSASAKLNVTYYAVA